MPNLSGFTTGERIRLHRVARGMSRPVLAGLVGRSSDWLKKIERGERQLTDLSMLLQIANILGISDLSKLTGNVTALPVVAWDRAEHPTVPQIRDAMREASFILGTDAITPSDLQQRVSRAWLLWHTSVQQRTVVGGQLPELIRDAHACVRGHAGKQRRQAQAATGDLYRLVQRLLAHICEPRLHALAVERGRAMSEEADTPLSLAHAAWSSAVSLSASRHYEEAVQLVEIGAETLSPWLDAGSANVLGLYGSLKLEAAAAYGFAGRSGDALRYLDQAESAARMLPPEYWHPQSAFERHNVDIMATLIAVSLHRVSDAIDIAEKLDLAAVPSVVRRSRVLLETSHAYRRKNDVTAALHCLEEATSVSLEAVALIPWARAMADEMTETAPSLLRPRASDLATKLKMFAMS